MLFKHDISNRKFVCLKQYIQWLFIRSIQLPYRYNTENVQARAQFSKRLETTDFFRVRVRLMVRVKGAEMVSIRGR